MPGDGHIWVMVLGDLVIFGAYFIIFMIYRAMKPQEFLACAAAPQHHHRRAEHRWCCLPVRGSSPAVCRPLVPASMSGRCG